MCPANMNPGPLGISSIGHDIGIPSFWPCISIWAPRPKAGLRAAVPRLPQPGAPQVRAVDPILDLLSLSSGLLFLDRPFGLSAPCYLVKEVPEKLDGKETQNRSDGRKEQLEPLFFQKCFLCVLSFKALDRHLFIFF